jgi:hypothetical protein
MMSLRRLFRRGQSDAVIQQEIELHLAEEIAENIERGMPADEARRQAHLKFGSPRRVREELWRQNSFAAVDTFWRDMRQVLRRLERSPSAVLTVMISLGLGIAANVFIFTAVNKLLLQEPPLGATRSGVQRLIVRQGVLLSCIAMGIGLPLAWAASRVVAGVLYGIAPHDWITSTTVPAFLAAVTLLACWIPARRAAKVEPQTALRHE